MKTKIFIKCPYCKQNIRISIGYLNQLTIIDEQLKEHDVCPHCGKAYKIYVNPDYKYCYLMILLPLLTIDFTLFYFANLHILIEIFFCIISLFLGFYLLGLFNYRLYQKRVIRLIPIDKEYIVLEDEDVE